MHTGTELYEKAQDMQGHPEGMPLGFIMVELHGLLADSGTTFKSIEDVRLEDGKASFRLTDYEHEPIRITLNFEYE